MIAAGFADTIVEFMSEYDGPPVVFAGYCAGFTVANLMSLPGAARAVRAVHLFTAPGAVGEFLSLPDMRPSDCHPDSVLAETLTMFLRMEYGEDYRRVVFVAKTPVGPTAGVDDPVKLTVDDEAWLVRPPRLQSGGSEYLTASNSWVQARMDKDASVVGYALRVLLGDSSACPPSYAVEAVDLSDLLAPPLAGDGEYEV